MRAQGRTVHEDRFDVADEAAVVTAFERLDRNRDGVAGDIRGATPASGSAARWWISGPRAGAGSSRPTRPAPSSSGARRPGA